MKKKTYTAARAGKVIAEKEVATRGKKINNLRAIGELVYTTPQGEERSWAWAQSYMTIGGYVQCFLWGQHEYMWMKLDKWIHIATSDKLYEPLTKEYLQKIGCKKLMIAKHYLKFRGGRLEVGYRVNKKEQEALWRVYIP